MFLFGLGVLGLMMTLGTILATLFVGLVAKAHPALSVYTLVSTGVILVTGGAAAASAAQAAPLIGLADAQNPYSSAAMRASAGRANSTNPL